MRVGVDVHIAAKPNRRGVPHYVEQVVPRLMEIGRNDEWALLHVGADWYQLPQPILQSAGLVRVQRRRLNSLVHTTLSRKTHDALLGALDVMFLPAIGPTRVSKDVPTVLTVHDVLHLTHLGQLGPRHRVWLKVVKPDEQIARARLLLANSIHTKNEIIRHADVDETAVRIVPHGVDDQYFESCAREELARVLARHNLKPGYVLHVGTLEPRKNLRPLVQAISLLRKRGRKTELVLAGAAGPASNVVEGQGSWVRPLGMVADDEKRALYRAAGAYCSVAHAEGLGLTPLEALACGTPAVVSAIPAFEESLGPDAACFVPDRMNPEVIANEIERVLDDETTRARVLTHAPSVLSRYRWAHCASATYEAIRDAADVDRSASVAQSPGSLAPIPVGRARNTAVANREDELKPNPSKHQ